MSQSIPVGAADVFDNNELRALKEERTVLLSKIKTFEKSFGEMVKSGEAFFSYSKKLDKQIMNYNGFQVWADYCDGNILIVNWKTDTYHTAELHVHDQSNEVIVVEEGEAKLHLPNRNQTLLLGAKHGRNIAYLTPKELHSLEITSYGAKGYAVLIPPDVGLIKEGDTCIYKNVVGTCHGNADCKYSQ